MLCGLGSSGLEVDETEENIRTLIYGCADCGCRYQITYRVFDEFHTLGTVMVEEGVDFVREPLKDELHWEPGNDGIPDTATVPVYWDHELDFSAV